ncbi:hypothetical protein GFB49_04370 [Epibacterium sp. SM1979]|uniref:Uncharacterized protein n=1 Tax=Tritonibacter litoralis TaxID=2662264 RepID=A0A843YEG3_9RHOB|nr:hypothetical protein [Tritonibacter litoralis]MQQ07683.1 hypothetical protein [Tritonibacter litoralis]
MSFLQNWPAFRSARPVPFVVRRRAVVIGCIAMVVTPFILPIVVGICLEALVFLGVSALEDQAEAFGVLMGFSLMGVIPAIILTIPLAMFAIKTGFAGWAVATASGGIVGYLLFRYVFDFDGIALLLGAGFGVAYAAIFWFAARLSTPLAFVQYDAGTEDQG